MILELVYFLIFGFGIPVFSTPGTGIPVQVTNGVGFIPIPLLGFFSGTITTTKVYSAFGANQATVPGTNIYCSPLIVAGTLKNLYINIVTNTLSALDNYTVTINLLSAPGTVTSSALTITFAGGVTGVKTDLTHSIAVSAGQYVAIGAISNAGSGTLSMWVGVEFDVT